MKIHYSFDSYAWQSREPSSGDEWDRGDTSTTWEAPTKVYLSKRHGETDTDEIDDVAIGQDIYLVWVQYGTGDTFGHDAGANHEVVGWYFDAEDAAKAQKAVEESKGETVMVPTMDGKGTREQYCGSWHGYFETFDFCHMERVMVCP